MQPWGVDGEKRRYWLVEGQNDTSFRVYREENPLKKKKVKWFSVAGSIDDLKDVAKKLEEEDGRKDAKALGERMLNAVPRFEASEVVRTYYLYYPDYLLMITKKRKRREYKANRDQAFRRPDPGFSLYEGRTRGKRLRYTFSDEEDMDSDNLGARRSARTSGRETPAVPSGPTVTASGRQVRSRATGLYGETLLSGQVSDRASPATGDYVRSDVSEEPQRPHAHGRSTRAAANGRPSRRIESDDEEDATSWDGGDEDEDEPEQMELDDDEEDQAEESSEEEEEPRTLMVTLRYGKGASNPSSAPAATNGSEEVSNGVHQHPTPLVGQGVPQQPEQNVPAPIELPLQSTPAALPMVPQPAPAAYASNGIPVVSQQAPMAPAAQPPVQNDNSGMLPKLDGMFSAPVPAPAYTAPQMNGVAPQQPPSQYPISQPAPPQQQPFKPTLPSPTPAANWQ